MAFFEPGTDKWRAKRCKGGGGGDPPAHSLMLWAFLKGLFAATTKRKFQNLITRLAQARLQCWNAPISHFNGGASPSQHKQPELQYYLHLSVAKNPPFAPQSWTWYPLLAWGRGLSSPRDIRHVWKPASSHVIPDTARDLKSFDANNNTILTSHGTVGAAS